MNKRIFTRSRGRIFGGVVVPVLLLAMMVLAGSAGAVNGYPNGLADHAAGPSVHPFAESIGSPSADSTSAGRRGIGITERAEEH